MTAAARMQRARSAAHKLRWGLRSVGTLATARGLLRLGALKVRPPQRVTVSLRSGGQLEFDPRRQMVPALVVFGDLIDPEYPFLRAISRPDWTVVDVGAAIGQFSVFAGVIRAASIHACEPSDANLETLRANIARNGIADRTTVHRAALSNAPGTANFVTESSTFVSHITSSTGDVAGESTVPVLTLDDAVEEWGASRIDVLKVNVAGFEPQVLEGATLLFDARRVDVVIALVGRQSLDAYQSMAKAGYRFFFFHPVEERLYEAREFDEEFLDWRPSPARHVIAIHADAFERVTGNQFPVVTRPGR